MKKNGTHTQDTLKCVLMKVMSNALKMLGNIELNALLEMIICLSIV